MSADDEERPARRWRTLAGFVVLLAGIGFFLLGALVPLRQDLSAPAYALLGSACVFFFGTQVGDWLPGILRAVMRGVAAASAKDDGDAVRPD